MMLEIMNRYRERLVFSDTSLLRELELEDTLAERISRIGVLTDK